MSLTLKVCAVELGATKAIQVFVNAHDLLALSRVECSRSYWRYSNQIW
jgi:hypothetical protein